MTRWVARLAGLLGAVAVVCGGRVAAAAPAPPVTVWMPTPHGFVQRAWTPGPGPVWQAPLSTATTWWPAVRRVALTAARPPGWGADPALTILLITRNPPATVLAAWGTLTRLAGVPVAVYVAALPRAGAQTADWTAQAGWHPWRPAAGWRWLTTAWRHPPTPRPPTVPGCRTVPVTATSLETWTWLPGPSSTPGASGAASLATVSGRLPPAPRPDSQMAWTYRLPNGGYVTCTVASPLPTPRVFPPAWRAEDAIGPLRALAATHATWLARWWPRSVTPSPVVAALLVLARLSPTRWGARPIAFAQPPSAATQTALRRLGWGQPLTGAVWPQVAVPASRRPASPSRLPPAAASAAGGVILITGWLGWRRWRRRMATPHL